MRIFKENFYDIVKLYVNHIGIMIFSFFILTAISGIGSEDTTGVTETVNLWASIASVLFLYILIYFVVWEIGAKDKIRIDGGRYEPVRAKGFLLGLFSGIPSYVLGILALVFYILHMNIESQGLSNFAGVLVLITRFHGSMYVGFIMNVTGYASEGGLVIVQHVLFILLPVIISLISHLAYTLGFKEKRIFGFMAPTRNTKKK